MKKLLVILFVAILAIGSASAAGKVDKPCSFGLKVGYNFPISEFQFRPMIGVFGDFSLGKKFSLIAEIHYSREIRWHDYSGFDEEVGNLNIPILANFHLSKGWALKVGLQPGFAVYSQNNGGANYNPTLAVPVGVSYDFDFGLILDARLNFSLNKIGLLQISAGYRF